MISRPLICFFWIMCLSVGLFEVIFTPLKEAGVVAIYMSILGLLREARFNRGEPETYIFNGQDFIQEGKY